MVSSWKSFLWQGLKINGQIVFLGVSLLVSFLLPVGFKIWFTYEGLPEYSAILLAVLLSVVLYYGIIKQWMEIRGSLMFLSSLILCCAFLLLSPVQWYYENIIGYSSCHIENNVFGLLSFLLWPLVIFVVLFKKSFNKYVLGCLLGAVLAHLSTDVFLWHRQMQTDMQPSTITNSDDNLGVTACNFFHRGIF